MQRCADVVALDEVSKQGSSVSEVFPHSLTRTLVQKAHDSQILICTPMANQTLFLAGCAELDEVVQHHTSQLGNNKSSTPSRSSRHLMIDAMESHRHFAAVLERMSVYWDGIRWIYGVLMQRRVGLSDNDLIDLYVGTDTLVSRREMVRGGDVVMENVPLTGILTTFLNPLTANAPKSACQ